MSTGDNAADAGRRRRLDEATADALRAYGGLGEREYPTAVVQIVETRCWDSDGRESANFHVYATDGTTRRQAASLIRDAAELVQGSRGGEPR